MSTITAILEVDADGSVTLPLAAELGKRRVRVVATYEVVDDKRNLDLQTPLAGLKRIAARGGLTHKIDPMEWQNEIREDRPLPGRE